MAQSQNQSYPQDPILEFRPPFAQSLPVQILVTGVALTLASVLFLHLLFTAQYHWPLARTNYILQITGVVTLLVSITASIYVILSANVQQSQHWPYMLSYLAVRMPHADLLTNSTDPTLLYQHNWTSKESATWVVLNATTSVVVQITHIHFLTFLFPSDLEARLILCLVGPLAIISAVMQILPIICGTGIATIAEDTRNVCNAALSLIFTAFLVIWGSFINRRQAWRTDGGTAAFGAGAISLALISTTLNFLYIPKQDQYSWMPKLMWAVTLWQSFLGWWWWVGAGMGVREVEELLLRENKRQRKRLLRAQRRKEHREKAKSVWKGVTSAFKPISSRHDVPEPEMLLTSPSPDASSVSTGTASSSSVWMQPVQIVQRWFARLWHAHLTAAHIQATERAERMHQVYHRKDERQSNREYQKQVVGWGLGSFGLREVERERQEEMEMEMEVRIPCEEDEEQWREVPAIQGSAPEGLRHRGPETRVKPEAEESTSLSVWWWRPFRWWRLKDSTTYR